MMDEFAKYYESNNHFPLCGNDSDLMDEMTVEEFKWKFICSAFEAGWKAKEKIDVNL